MHMSLGQKTKGNQLKVSTWANRSPDLNRTPGFLGTMRVQFYGLSEDEYPEALADAVFQLEVEIGCGSWIH